MIFAKNSVVAVARAMDILGAFKPGELGLGLREIARRTGIPKTTVLRIARTMAAGRYLVQLADGAWRLGAACGWAGFRYNVAFDAVVIEPILRDVSRRSGETASFFVREGWNRVCIARVDSPRASLHHVRVGEILPLDKGATAAVLLAFSGERGILFDRIRRAGYHAALGHRSPSTGSVAYPVFGANRTLIGCISLVAPRERFHPSSIARYSRIVQRAASQLTFELSVRHSKMNGRRPRGLRQV